MLIKNKSDDKLTLPVIFPFLSSEKPSLRLNSSLGERFQNLVIPPHFGSKTIMIDSSRNGSWGRKQNNQVNESAQLHFTQFYNDLIICAFIHYTT